VNLMQNLRGQLDLLTGLDPGVVFYLTAAFLLFALVVSALLFWRTSGAQSTDSDDRLGQRGEADAGKPMADRNTRQQASLSSSDDFKIRASICSLLLLISSPHTHIHDYLVSALPCLWLWSATQAQPPRRSRTILRAAILAFPFLSWTFFLLRNVFELARLQPFFLWAIVVAVCALRQLRPHPRAAC